MRRMADFDQVVGNLRWIAEHQIQDPGREPGVVKGPYELHRSGRRFLGSLEDDRTAGGQRAADFSRGRTHREIPGRERCHGTDRLTQHGMPHALFARDDAAIDPPPLGRIPFEHVAAAQNLQPGLIDWLALFKCHRDRHVIDALADQACGFQDDLRSLGGGRLAPDCKSPFGGRERIVEIGSGRGRDGPEDAFIGRIDDRLAARALPAAVDIRVRYRGNLP
jgi:hypothetical protein